MRGRRALFLVVAAWLLAAAPAHAADRFVAATGSDASASCSAGAPCLTVQHALDVAAASGDRVVVGAGTFTGHAATTKHVDVVGAGATGAGATILAGDASPTLHMQGGGSVSQLDVRGGDMSTGQVGLQLDSTSAATTALAYDVSNVRLDGAAACSGCGGLFVAGPDAAVPNLAVAVTIDHVDDVAGPVGGFHFTGTGASATVRDTTVEVDGPFVHGFLFSAGADGTIADSTVSGSGKGIQIAGTSGATPTAPERSIVTATRVRMAVDSLVAEIALGSFSATDSLLSASEGIVVQSLSPADGAADVALRGVTLYVTGGAGTRGVQAFQGGGSNPATAELTNTIVRAVPATSDPTGVIDIEAHGPLAAVTASHSSFTTTILSGGAPAGAIPTPGAGTNLMGDPLLVAPATGDFHLAATSPLIDKGDASVVTAGETDFAGAARSLDGNGDCAAAPDVGAYEAPAKAGPHCPPPGGGGGGGGGGGSAAQTLSGVAFSPATFRVALAPRKPHKPKGRKAQASAKRRARAHARGSRLKATVGRAGTLQVTLVRCRNKRCTRTARAGSLSFKVHAGRNSLAFTARLGRRHTALKLGRYRATVVALDAAKRRSPARTAYFTLVAR